MILNVLVVVMFLVITLLWGTNARGFGVFSAFLTLISTLIAGAVAFALWEQTAHALLGFGSSDGAFGGMMRDTAWGLALLGPFVLTLLAVRMAFDFGIKGDLQLSPGIGQLGGIVCGLLIATITSGMVVLSVGYMNLPPKLMGYAPIGADTDGNLAYVHKLWIPTDLLTVKLYEHLSTGSLSTATPLALLRPAAHRQAGMQRASYRGAAKTSVAPDDVRVTRMYRIDGQSSDLLRDIFDANAQTVKYLDQSDPPQNARLEGYVIELSGNAKETGTNIILMPAQVALVIREARGRIRTVHPIAVVAPPAAGGRFDLYRFRFDKRGVEIASSGSRASFGFEFIIAPDATPISLLVKNIRIDVSGDTTIAQNATVFPSRQARDDAISNGTLLSGS